MLDIVHLLLCYGVNLQLIAEREVVVNKFTSNFVCSRASTVHGTHQEVTGKPMQYTSLLLQQTGLRRTLEIPHLTAHDNWLADLEFRQLCSVREKCSTLTMQSMYQDLQSQDRSNIVTHSHGHLCCSP